MKRQFEILVFGRVQGVGFRAACMRKARYWQLRGRVQNLPDGSVRIVLNGDEELCTKFIAWCRDGSSFSWVERIELQEMKPEDLEPFSIIY